MIDKLLQTDLENIKRGYTWDATKSAYCCLLCTETFELGEVFPIEGKFYEASKAVQSHVRKVHGNMLDVLASYDKKLTGITDNQKELLSLFASGFSDSEIAKRMDVAASTIRHQRFVLRERAKQAKMYLAIFELAEEGAKSAGTMSAASDELVDVPNGATMLDDRFIITRGEEEKILRIVFASLEPLRLKAFPPKEKRKIIILKKITAQFEAGKRYSEKEVNLILAPIFEDYATLRRYLIEYGFMERTIDCKEYWINE